MITRLTAESDQVPDQIICSQQVIVGLGLLTKMFWKKLLFIKRRGRKEAFGSQTSHFRFLLKLGSACLLSYVILSDSGKILILADCITAVAKLQQP